VYNALLRREQESRMREKPHVRFDEKMLEIGYG
jgi:hypothetical protein